MPPNKRFPIRFQVPLLSAALALGVVTYAHRTLMGDCFSKGSYYLIALLFGCWIFVSSRYALSSKTSLLSLSARYKTGLLLSVFLATLLFISVKPAFRVLSDEANLVAVSKAMAFEKRVDFVTMGKWYYENYTPVARALDKRPCLFPFSLHLLHVVLGFRVANVFVLNYLILVLFLFLIFILVHRKLGTMGAGASLFFITAQPIVSQCATSGGFELFQVFFVLLSFMALSLFLENPTKATFELLWVQLLMLSNIRYESAAFFGVTLALLLIFRKIKPEFIKSSFVAAATPLLMLPYLWQRILKIHDFEIPQGESVFSVQHLLENNIDFLNQVFSFDPFQPMAHAVNILGMLSIFYFVYLFVKRISQGTLAKKHLILISAINLIAMRVIVTSYYFGIFSHPSSNRLYLLFSVVLSLLAVFFCFQSEWIRKRPYLVLGVSLLLFAYYHPVSMESRFSKSQYAPRKYQAIMETLKRQSDRHLLLIVDRPVLYSIHDIGALHFAYANQSRGVILRELKRHLFSTLLVAQEIEYKTMKPQKGDELNSAYILEPVYEIQNTSDSFIRISRVKNG